jgi:uncharacterized membrane protein YeaQ/YmgE (transglycosylase-associated protein family)
VEIWATLVGGAVVALIVQIIKKGKTKLPLWGLYACGIVGAIGGYKIAEVLGVEATRGVDWIRWAVSVGVALVAIWLVGALRPKK